MFVEVTNKTLAVHLKNGHIASSYLIVDRDIATLRGIATWFSKNFNVADIFWLTPKDGAQSIQVAETLEFMQRSYLAAVGERKLCIICDTSTMTPAAQNKMLKTLEETPPNTTFMLLATSAEPILNTIKSRCITIYSDPLPSKIPPSVKGVSPTATGVFKLFACKTLDEALPLIPELTKKENFHEVLCAISDCAKNLPTAKRYATLSRLAIINRNVAANCNPQNQFDTLLMEIFE